PSPRRSDPIGNRQEGSFRLGSSFLGFRLRATRLMRSVLPPSFRVLGFCEFFTSFIENRYLLCSLKLSCFGLPGCPRNSEKNCTNASIQVVTFQF
ncbi:unnamed protein product, partial [Linum tenue]